MYVNGFADEQDVSASSSALVSLLILLLDSAPVCVGCFLSSRSCGRSCCSPVLVVCQLRPPGTEIIAWRSLQDAFVEEHPDMVMVIPAGPSLGEGGVGPDLRGRVIAAGNVVRAR